jgi:hypothetical protein
MIRSARLQVKLVKPEPQRATEEQEFYPFIQKPSCGTLASMGSKDKGKKEAKKAPKPKPKPEPGRRREGFIPTPPK